MEQFSRLFTTHLQILCWFLACKSITSILKSNAYKDTYFLYLKGWSNTFFYFKKDMIPPGIHTAGRRLGIAMQYFQNACFFPRYLCCVLIHSIFFPWFHSNVFNCIPDHSILDLSENESLPWQQINSLLNDKTLYSTELKAFVDYKINFT